jgi:hypothetical protein
MVNYSSKLVVHEPNLEKSGVDDKSEEIKELMRKEINVEN